MGRAKKKAPSERGLEYDAQAAERGWEATKALRAVIESASIPGVDLRDVAIFGLSVARDLLKPEIRGRYELLPDELFDHAILDRIEPAAWAVWYAENRRETAEAGKSNAQVDAVTLTSALDIKSRMMKVCEYVLSDDPEDGPEVASIRSGSGYVDLASDLARLGNLYEKHEDELDEGGGKHYRASDAKDAKKVSADILAQLSRSDTPTTQNAKDDAARAFAVFEQAYDEIRVWAPALFRDEDRFPSIYTLRPNARRRPRAGTPGDDAASGGPVSSDASDGPETT